MVKSRRQVKIGVMENATTKGKNTSKIYMPEHKSECCLEVGRMAYSVSVEVGRLAESTLLVPPAGCTQLFQQELAKKWGKHCQSCVFCQSTSQKLVTAQYGGSTEEFCSDDCRSKYTMLFCHVRERERTTCDGTVIATTGSKRCFCWHRRWQSATRAAARGN